MLCHYIAVCDMQYHLLIINPSLFSLWSASPVWWMMFATVSGIPLLTMNQWNIVLSVANWQVRTFKLTCQLFANFWSLARSELFSWASVGPFNDMWLGINYPWEGCESLKCSLGHQYHPSRSRDHSLSLSRDFLEVRSSECLLNCQAEKRNFNNLNLSSFLRGYCGKDGLYDWKEWVTNEIMAGLCR